MGIARPGRRTGLDMGLAVAAGLLPLLVAVRLVDVGIHGWAIPWAGGDMVTAYALAKNMAAGNWFLFNPDLGFPGVQDLGHYPVPDLLGVAAIGLLTLAVPSPIAAVNLFVVSSFFTIGVATYLVMRRLRVLPVFALLLSWSYTLLPWHFFRSYGHIFLANYLSVPLALLLIDAVARRRLEKDRRAWVLFAYVLAGLVIGINGVYYAFMASVLIGTVLVVGLLVGGARPLGWRTLLISCTVPVATLAAVVVSKASVFTATTGETVIRNPEASLQFGGTIATLFFPDPSTWSGRHLSRFLHLYLPVNAEGAALYSSSAVIATLVTCYFIGKRWTRNDGISPNEDLGRVSFWPALYLLVVAFFTVGSLGTLFSYWVTDDIRAWGRFSIYLAGISFLIAGLALTAWRGSAHRWQRVAAVGVAFVMAALALVDVLGVSLPPRAPYAALATEVESFTDELDARLPENCPILQLPLMSYPENGPVGNMGDYEPLWPYLYSDDLRWSYGGVKGTPAGDWGMDVKADPARLLETARETGFCGILVDATSYESPADALAYYQVLGDPDLVSSSGRWVFFDLSGPQTGEYVYEPTKGFAEAESSVVDPLAWWMTSTTGSLLVSGEPNARLSVSLEFGPTPCGGATIEVAGGEYQIDERQTVEVETRLSSEGSTTLPIKVLSEKCNVPGDDRDLMVQLIGQDPRSESVKGGYEPVSGFSAAESTLTDPVFWWMTSQTGELRVAGPPGSSGTVTLDVAPPPCGPTTVSVGGQKSEVDARRDIDVQAQFDEDGAAMVTIEALSGPCAVSGDTRPLWLQLFGR